MKVRERRRRKAFLPRGARKEAIAVESDGREKGATRRRALPLQQIVGADCWIEDPE
jgi:hypothetical protein